MEKKQLKQYKKIAYITTLLAFLITLNGKSQTNTILPNTNFETTKINTKNTPNNFNESLEEIKTYINEIGRETIYLGDSRTAGILETEVIDLEHTIYGIGYGYKWLIGQGTFKPNKTNAQKGALNELSNKIKENTLYNIVIWLGVNDYKYYSAETYFEQYVQLALNNKEHNIYIVSVGPVDENPNCPRSNAPINEFNITMEELIKNANIENLRFIDLELTKKSIKNYDYAGIHYGINDYIYIQNLIETHINKEKVSLLTLK